MQESIRRVNKLRLSTGNESALHGDIAALQDAFRIASLPGIPPQGLLLVRQLDLGAFPTRSSAQALSHLIDRRMRNTVTTAIRADHGDFTDRPLVWFSDPAAAALGLAERVATGRDPRAWYWRALFPHWRPGMNLAATLVAIAAGLRAQAPVAAVLRELTACLLATQPAARIVDAIDRQLAHSLLHDAGVCRGAPKPQTEQTAPPAATADWAATLPAWRQPIASALARWGGADPRCLWLGYCALTVANPALALDSQMLARIEALLDGFSQPVNTRSVPPTAAGEAGTASPRPESATATATPTTGEWSRSAPPAPGRPPGYREAAPTAGPASSQPSYPAPPPAPTANNRPVKSGADAAAPAERRRHFGDGERHDPQPVALPPEAVVARLPPRRSAGTVADIEPVPFNGLVGSEFAGLALVIRLLELLAIEHLLEQYPPLADMNLPAVVVADVARRLGVPPDHPLLLALPRPLPVENRLESFECPATWRELIAAPGADTASLHRFDTTVSGSRCYLTDRSRQIPVYAGDGQLPRWARRHRISRHRGVHPAPALGALVPGIQLLIGRYLRRYGDISLRRLIRRPGRLAPTRTHLDVVFAIEQTDIRIRRAGLDVDPGWVAWLARVVRFHYLEGEVIDV